MHPSLFCIPALFLAPDSRDLPALPPEVELTGFTRTSATSLDDFLGQAVLLEFFAHWCAPCARQVPHLNELASDFEALGLVVLGVTGDTRERAEPWLAQNGAKYAYAFDPELRLQIELGFHPLPFAVLLDPTGLITWMGSPGELEGSVIEATLEHVLPPPAGSWPEAGAPVREALRRDELGNALRAAEALADAGLREELGGFVRALVRSRLALLETSWARGDYLMVHELGEALARGLAGRAEGAGAEALQQRLRDEAEASAILAAQRELRELWRGVAEIATKAGAEALREKVEALATRFPDTYVSFRAAGYATALQALASSLD